MKRKCPMCGEVKFIKDFSKHKNKKDGLQLYCKACCSKMEVEYKSTELGYLKDRYRNISTNRGPKCCFTFDEFFATWKKHKSIYGMRSAWGPHHLPITMIYQGRGEGPKGQRNCGSNLSPDRLDSSKPYTIQNLIFIRNDENVRKKDTTYEDCLTHIKLHEERFINMGAI